MNEKLLPCPFCEGEAFTHILGNEIAKGYYIACDECGVKTKVFGYEAEAIEAWNRRSERAERTAKVEKVDTNSPHSQVYKCCKCGQYTHRTAWSRDVHYCPSCGSKLEWGDHE